MLNTYQLRQSNHLENHIGNELQELKKKVALRKALLEERVWTVFVLYLIWLSVCQSKWKVLKCDLLTYQNLLECVREVVRE